MLAHVWRGGNKTHTDNIKQIGLQQVNALRISCLANLFAFLFALGGCCAQQGKLVIPAGATAKAFSGEINA
jgi:hypothetical protein